MSKKTKSILLILGSSLSKGNTYQLSQDFSSLCDASIIDLNDYDISPWDYKHSNYNDDFIIVARLMQKVDVIVFATPVYWYAMSSQMKTFFDRLSDLVSGHEKVVANKTIGRSFANKETFLLTTGCDSSLPEGFEVPFA